MSMPKGYKVVGGYATVSKDIEGTDYRTISEIMTSDGHKMNHATARNKFLRVMEKFAASLGGHMNESISSSAVKEIARNPQFQHGICELVQGIYSGRRNT